MYDNGNRYDRKSDSGFERSSRRDERGYDPRDSFGAGNSGSRRFRSEQPSKSKSARGFFGVARGEQQTSGGDSSNVVIYSPSTFADVQALIDYLKRREQVIVDFSGIDQTAVYRIMDFMSGAIYALNGSIQQITRNIFLFAPAGVTITVPPQFNGRR